MDFRIPLEMHKTLDEIYKLKLHDCENEMLVNRYAFYTSTLLMLKYYAHLSNFDIGMWGIK